MTTITNNKLPEWRTALDKCVENYQSTRAWYEENRDSPAALDDMERAEDQFANFVSKCGFSIVLGLLDEIDELQEHRKAAAEPVLYVMGMGCAFDAETASTCKGAVDSWVGEWNQERLPGQEEYKTVPLYATPPVSERERIRREHAEWSDATFGDVAPIGPLKHLSKEALETAAKPDDLSEWADMQFLLWDAQRRAGIGDEQITQAMVGKLKVNKQREWPEPKDGEPRLHIKEQPASVVPEEKCDDDGNTTSEFDHGWNACRAAMLQGQYRDLSQPVDPQISEYEKIMLQAGWVMMPVEPTDEMIAAAMECEGVIFDSKDPTAFCVQYREIYFAMVDAAPKQEGNNG